MISLTQLINEKRDTIPEERIKERTWVLIFSYRPTLNLLMARDNEGHWSFPGGQLDKGETSEETAWRELKEETDLVPNKLEFLKTVYHDKPNKLKVSHIFYGVVDKNVKTKPNDDVERLKWFSVNDLPYMGDLSKTKKEVAKLAAQRVYKAKDELKEHLEIAKKLKLPIQSDLLLTEGRKRRKKTINGYLIVFEGIDGAGKSSQRKNLQQWLENKKWKVTISKWGTSPYISELLKNGKQNRWLTPSLYSLLHASDMIWRYDNEIKPALEEGHVVICDRYYYTSYARDKLRGINEKLLDEIYKNFPEPDLVVHFKVPPRLAVERLMKDKGFKWYSSGMDIGYHKNMEESALIYEKKMDQQYDIVLKKAKNYRHVDSERSIREIFKEIKRFIYERIKSVRRIPSTKPKYSLIKENLSFFKILKNILLERLTFKQLLDASEEGRKQRARTDVKVRPMRVTSDDNNEKWTFSYESSPSTTGKRWHGYVQFFKENVGNNENAEDLDIICDCQCPDFSFRFAYNDAKAGASIIGPNSLNKNNGNPPRPRSQGGIGDYGIGMCKHLAALSEYLHTKVEPNAPEAGEKTEPIEEPPEKAEIPIAAKSPSINSPEPEDSYSDYREGGTLEEDHDEKSLLYERMENFVRSNPEFEVLYED